MTELKNLYARQSTIHRDLKKMVDEAKESDKWTDEVDTEYNSLNNEFNKLSAQITLLEIEENSDTGTNLTESAASKENYLYDTRGKKHRVYAKGEKLSSGVNILNPGNYLNAKIFGASSEIEERALSTSSGQSLKTEFDKNLIDRLRAESTVMRAGAVTIPIDANSRKISRLTSDLTSSFKSEGGTTSPSDPGIETVSLETEALITLNKLSVQAHDDSINVGECLLKSAIGSMNTKLDNAALEGSGSSPIPEGVFNYTNVQDIPFHADGSKFSTISYTGLLAGQKALHDANCMNINGIIMSPRSYQDMQDLQDTTGQPLQMPSSIAKMPIYISGSGVISDARTKGAASSECSTIYLGDWTNLLFVVRQDLEILISKERYIEDFSVAFGFTMRVNFYPMNEEAFCKIEGVLSEDSELT